MALVLPMQCNGFQAEQDHDASDESSTSTEEMMVTNENGNGQCLSTINPNAESLANNAARPMDELDELFSASNDSEDSGDGQCIFTNDFNDESFVGIEAIGADVMPTDNNDIEDTTSCNSSSSMAILNDILSQEDDVVDMVQDGYVSAVDTTFCSAMSDDSTSSFSFGGLSNLGNTCYMASALQMLASLEKFGVDLRNRAPLVMEEDEDSEDEENKDSEDEENKDSEEEDEDKKETQSVRNALLDVLDRLSRGETVRPEDFKSCLDSRTALFEGYWQQDAHEFLTTLLDLIDEEYKKNENNEKKAEEEETMSTDEETMNTDEESSSGTETETSEMEAEEVCNTVRESPSFQNLKVDDIQDLLFGKQEPGAEDVSQVPALKRDDEPKCQLLGGRMSSSHADLTRYEPNDKIDMETATEHQNATSKPQTQDDDSEVSEGVTSPVDSNFTTEVRVSLTCESCKYRRSHKETYLHLSLEMGSSCCSSVEDGLRKFFAPEKREVKCEKCFHDSAEQTVEITRLPSALLIHLKRFIVDVSPDYTSISYRKDLSSVSFDERMPLETDHGGVFEEFLAPDVAITKGSSYAIRSVVNHIGASASCGHYTADAKRQYPGNTEEEREWTRFNDSYVSKVSADDAVTDSARTAYLIMYELKDD